MNGDIHSPSNNFASSHTSSPDLTNHLGSKETPLFTEQILTTELHQNTFKMDKNLMSLQTDFSKLVGCKSYSDLTLRFGEDPSNDLSVHKCVLFCRSPDLLQVCLHLLLYKSRINVFFKILLRFVAVKLWSETY